MIDYIFFMKIFTLLTLVLLASLMNQQALAKGLKIVFVNPGHPNGDATGIFWSEVNRFMQASARDLDIELITVFANRNHILMNHLTEQVTSHNPDYTIIVNEKAVGFNLFKKLAARNVPVFTLLNNLSKQQIEKLTMKQKSLHVGSLVPDNYLAGKMLADDLYQIHKQKNNPPPYYLLSLAGDHTSPASIERSRGLQAYLAQNQHIKLIDQPVANWSKQEAFQKVSGLLKRTRIDIIWAANDPMAFGSVQAVAGAKLDHNVTIGGINWDKNTSEFQTDVSYGGHVTLGAKSLVMLYDFHHKQMQPCEMHENINIFKSDLLGNKQHFINRTQAQNIDSVDFSRFSKSHPHPITFTIDSFISGSKAVASTEPNKVNCS